MTKPVCIALLAIGLCLSSYAEETAQPTPAQPEEIEEQLTAVQTLRACTRLLPTEKLILTGEICMRKARGIVLERFPYKLMLDWGATPSCAEILLLNKSGDAILQRAVLTRSSDTVSQIAIFNGPEQKRVQNPNYSSRIMGTDITWLDLSLDFLWWPDARFDNVPRGDSRNGRDCDILITTPPQPIPGCTGVRVWVDRKLRCIMQAEQLGPQGDPVRKFWVQRVKKMNDRWMIKDMEVETLNSGHRTQLLVDDVASASEVAKP